MSDGGDVLKVDQEHLETVIPAIGTVASINLTGIRSVGEMSAIMLRSRGAQEKWERVLVVSTRRKD